MASIADKVSALIKQHKAIVFSKTYCPYCDNAKRAFAAVSVAPHVVELDQGEYSAHTAEYQAALGKLTGATSVPRVFINGKFLGGGDDTVAAQRSGRLAELCREAGIL